MNKYQKLNEKLKDDLKSSVDIDVFRSKIELALNKYEYGGLGLKCDDDKSYQGYLNLVRSFRWETNEFGERTIG